MFTRSDELKVSQCQINDKWKKYIEEWNDGTLEY